MGIFHVTNSGNCTWYDFANKILSLRKNSKQIMPITSLELTRLAKRPPYSVLSTDKFYKSTGYNLRNWEEALGEYLSL
jgi:dTDP-4-dehydrorhamnose reductase